MENPVRREIAIVLIGLAFQVRIVVAKFLQRQNVRLEVKATIFAKPNRIAGLTKRLAASHRVERCCGFTYRRTVDASAGRANCRALVTEKLLPGITWFPLITFIRL